MSPIAIQERLDGNAVDSMEKVSDEQHRGSAPAAQSLRRGNAQAAARRHHDPAESLARSDSRLAGKSKTIDLGCAINVRRRVVSALPRIKTVFVARRLAE
jgi:hypothetical protein